MPEFGGKLRNSTKLADIVSTLEKNSSFKFFRGSYPNFRFDFGSAAAGFCLENKSCPNLPWGSTGSPPPINSGVRILDKWPLKWFIKRLLLNIVPKEEFP
jgi:hypothetical protein